MTAFRLDIPEASPSLNTMRGRHWSHHYQLRKHWSQLIMVAKCQRKLFGITPLPKAEVKITREGYRALDTDNFVGGLKCIIDSLREQSFIVDDTPAHITLVTAQKVIPKSAYPRTLIEIKLL